MMSPGSILAASSPTTGSVIPAGIITHATRGRSSFATKSSSEAVPIAPSRSSSATASGLTSKTTHSWSSRIRRRTMFAPIRPRPMIPSCISVPPFAVSIAPDQRVGGRVVREVGLLGRLELAGDARRKHLAELDAPLVERVDPPDHALHEDAVFVESDELAECRRIELLREDGVRRPVAVEDAIRLVCVLAERERLRLGEDVRRQEVVVIPDGIERLQKADEVAGDQPRALVDQLVEGVLAVRARLAPIDRARVVVDAGTVERD